MHVASSKTGKVQLKYEKHDDVLARTAAVGMYDQWNRCYVMCLQAGDGVVWRQMMTRIFSLFSPITGDYCCWGAAGHNQRDKWIYTSHCYLRSASSLKRTVEQKCIKVNPCIEVNPCIKVKPCIKVQPCIRRIYYFPSLICVDDTMTFRELESDWADFVGVLTSSELRSLDKDATPGMLCGGGGPGGGDI